MSIKQDSVVSIDYALKNDEGTVIDTSEGAEPLYYLHGHQQIVPGLEHALTGKAVDAVVSVVVPPEEGYGQRDPSRVFPVPRSKMPEGMELSTGAMLRMQTPEGASVPLVITEVTDDNVTVDANHALAGMTLHFDVTVRSVRDASEEELAHGHVHGPGGAH